MRISGHGKDCSGGIMRPDGQGLPFRIDRHAKCNLVSQVVDGFRQAIRSGRYRPGDTLPTIRALAPQLGVSVRVTAEAVKVLASEGFIAPRPRLGSVVLAHDERQWRGTVAIVLAEGYGYYPTEMCACLRKVLTAAGYFCTQVTIPVVGVGTKGKRYDISMLRFVLDRNVDFAILLFRGLAVTREFEHSDVPFITVDMRRDCVPGSVGTVFLDYDSAIAALVAQCMDSGVKKVVQVCKGRGEASIVSAMSAAGIAVEKKIVDPDGIGVGRIWNLQKSAFDMFKKWMEGGAPAWPDLIYFTDDYLTSGALLALEHLRVRIPEDVRIATLSNRGCGPLAWGTLARMENDPAVHGRIVADAILSYFASGAFPKNVRLPVDYIPGDSFPVLPKSAFGG